MNYRKISDEDWEKVKEYAVKLANISSDEEQSEADIIEGEIVREALLHYLSGLDKKYGPHPQIYDTIADYVPNGKDPLPWRLQAYEICSEKEQLEKIFITESLCQHFMLNKPDRKNALYWLEKLTRHCQEYGDAYYLTYPDKVRKEIEEQFGANG